MSDQLVGLLGAESLADLMAHSAIVVAVIVSVLGAWILLRSFNTGGENVPADPVPADPAPADVPLCSICWSEGSDIVQPKALQCGHVFCEACIGEWFSDQATRGNQPVLGSCPHCRDQVLPPCILFYPNICSTGLVRVDGVDAYTTHDIGAANHDQRHLIDRAFVQALPRGDALLAGLVPPTPPCGEFVTGTGAPEPGLRIVGMLARPLAVDLFVPGSRSLFAQSVTLKLGGVLVIDQLPVQMHVSVKSLRRSVDASALKLAYSALQSDETRLEKENFPDNYHSHPYWNSDGISVGSAAFIRREDYGQAVEIVGRRLQRAGVQDTAVVRWSCVLS